ncbi:MAG TPA: hypothetical protein VFJ76_07635 [Solirubrobacterales bacterium]|nr:hypothetical protein [Solirubrobacterales bacterium]
MSHTPEALEYKIRRALAEEPHPPLEALLKAGIEVSDEEFLNQAEKARVHVGDQVFVPFWGRIEIRWDHLEDNGAVAQEIANLAVEIARSVARYNALKGKP